MSNLNDEKQRAFSNFVITHTRDGRVGSLGGLAACKKRTEEQRVKNEKILLALKKIENKVVHTAHDEEFWNLFETIKAALEGK